MKLFEISGSGKGETVLIYQFPDNGREVHMMGNYVGVCFRIEKQTTRTREGNRIITVDTWSKEEYPMPYIDFIRIGYDNKDEPYIDDDSPVSGGLSAKEADQIINELKMAVNYIEGRNWE